MTPYAIDTELSDRSGIAVADLPANVGVILQRASEQIAYWTRGNVDPDNADHTAALRDATCELAVAWINNEGDGSEGGGRVTQAKTGDLTITYANAGPAGTMPWAVRAILFPLGLLYRGVGVA